MLSSEKMRYFSAELVDWILAFSFRKKQPLC